MTTKNRKPKATTRTLAQVVISEFAETGEITGLLALADWYAENEQQPELAALIRGVGAEWERVRFFYRNAGSSYRPARESEAEGQLRYAIKAAEAEKWLHAKIDDGEASVEWEQDEYHPHWMCVVEVDGSDTNLSGIDFEGDGEPWGKPYKRVVEAELALELMPDAE